MDLGVNIHAFEAEAATTNLTWNLDSSFISFNNTGDPLTFNVAAVDKNGGVSSGATLDSVMESYPTGPSAFAATLTGTQLNGLQTNVANYIQGYAQSASSSSEIITDPNSPAYFNSQFWGVGQGNSGAFQSAVAGGGGADKLSVMFLNTPGTTISRFNSTIMTQTLPVGFFSLNAGNDTLVWNAVPVPSAVWLFLGGVMSVLGYQKRKWA